MTDRIITGIEIGETRLRLAVGRYRPDSVRVVCHLVAESGGIEKGRVTDVRGLSTAINDAIYDAERVLGISLESVVLTVPHAVLMAHQTEATVQPSGSGSTVTARDGEALLEESQSQVQTGTRRIMQVIPRRYILDGEAGFNLPVGAKGQELTAFTCSISGESATVDGIRHAASLVEIENPALVPAPLAGCLGALTEGEQQLGTIHFAIGERSSSVTLMRVGRLLDTTSIPVGTDHFINDVSVALSIPYPAAESLIQERGSVSQATGPAQITLKPETGDDVTVDRVRMISVLQDRASELFNLARQHLDLGEKPMGGIVLSGAAAEIKGIAVMARDILGCAPVRIAGPRGIEGIPQMEAQDPAWVTVFGALAWATTGPALAAHPWLDGRLGEQAGVMGRWGRWTRGLIGTRDRAHRMGAAQAADHAGNDVIPRELQQLTLTGARSRREIPAQHNGLREE